MANGGGECLGIGFAGIAGVWMIEKLGFLGGAGRGGGVW